MTRFFLASVAVLALSSGMAQAEYRLHVLHINDFHSRIEPINRFDMPGFYLNYTRQAIAILDEVGADNIYLQYDIYHAQRMEGELAATLQHYLPRIAHMQLADNPGRHEPGTGEINYAFLFAHLDRIGYQGWIGCEYRPLTSTEAGLGWIERLTTG